MWQELLDADGPVEAEAVAVGGLETRGVHAGGVGLDGLEHLDPRIQKIVDDVEYRPVGVKHHVSGGRVPANALRQLPVNRLRQVAVRCARQQQAVLAARVIGQKHDVNQSLGNDQNPVESLDAEAGNVFERPADQVRVDRHVDHCFLQPGHPAVGLERVGGEEQGRLATRRVGLDDLARQRRVVVVPRVGPGVIVQGRRVLDAGNRPPWSRPFPVSYRNPN